MIDRTSRNKIVDAIKKYMNDEISAFEFDDVLWEIATEDETAKDVCKLLWYFYDDCNDHKVVADKETWDLFNRLLLLLESDGELHTGKTKKIWSIRNLIAGLSLFPFIYIVIETGWGQHLFIYSIPFGIVSMVLSHLNTVSARKRLQSNAALEPFPSFCSLRLIRSRVPSFKKIKYPHVLSKRRIRNIIYEKIMFLPSRIVWLMFAPIVLFCQMFPDKETEITLNVPELTEDVNPASAIVPSG